MVDREARKKQLIKELNAESDRGCILVAASALDVFLEEVLRTKLVADPHVLKHAVTALFEPMGPLSTFSAKIKLAYGLGLITKSSFTDLEKIRKIRNIASHEYSSMTFESQEILEISRTLEGADLAAPYLPVLDKKPDTGRPEDTTERRYSMDRVRFSVTVGWLAGCLNFTSQLFESNLRSRDHST